MRLFIDIHILPDDEAVDELIHLFHWGLYAAKFVDTSIGQFGLQRGKHIFESLDNVREGVHLSNGAFPVLKIAPELHQLVSGYQCRDCCHLSQHAL